MSMGIVNKDTAATIPAAGNTGDKVGNLAALHTTVKSDIVAAVNEVKDEQANKADMDIVADAFSAAETYAEGDYCTYEGGLYKFKAAHEGAWDAADVDQIQIAGELSELKNTLNYKTPRINLSAVTSTSVKDFLTKMCQQIQGLTLTNYVIYTSIVERVNVDYFSVAFFRTASKTVVFFAIPGSSAELYAGQLPLNGTITAYRYGGTAI